MAYDFQVVVDCTDPHRLADWWADALGWRVEPSDEDFIRTMIEQGHASEQDTTTHNGTLVWREGAAIRHPGDPPQGAARRILFQLVPEPKTVKNRLHLDIWVGAGRAEDELARLTERGATFLHRGRQGAAHLDHHRRPGGKRAVPVLTAGCPVTPAGSGWAGATARASPGGGSPTHATIRSFRGARNSRSCTRDTRRSEVRS